MTAAGPARPVERPYMMAAQAAFDALPQRDRNEIFLELIATGDFNALISDQFGTRLYDAIATFQSRNGLVPSGVLTPQTRAALSDIGGKIFNSWGFEFLDHPYASAAIVYPTRFGLASAPTPHGFALENRTRTMSIDFSFFPDTEATLDSVFGNLTKPAANRRIDFKVLRPTSFVVAGGSPDTGSYSRYILVPGGIAGFTIAWKTDAFPNAIRVAIAMASELYPRHMVSGGDLFDSLPGDPAPTSPSAKRPPDEGAFTGDTPTSAGSDAIGQAVLQAKLDAQRKADQEAADRRIAADAAARAAAEERLRLARQADLEREAKAETERLARQEAAARQAKADEDARNAAAAQLRADRLARAIADARIEIAEASGFVKVSHDDPALIDHLTRIARLNGALTSTDPALVENGTAELKAGLAADPGFADFETQRKADRIRENALYLADAVRVLRLQREFLVGTSLQDATSPNTPRFLDLVREIDAALPTPELEKAQLLMGTVQAAIREAGLESAYEAAVAAAKPDPTPSTPAPKSANLLDAEPGTAAATPVTAPPRQD